MKTLLFLILMLPIFVAAQKCRYDVDKYDKFLKIRKLEKEVKVNKADWGGDGYLKFDFCKYDSSTFFRITYITTRATAVGKNDALIFLLEDESLVKAFPNRIYSGDIRIGRVSTQFVLNATYDFENSDDIEKLKKQKVKSIRIYYNSVFNDHDIKDKFSDDLYETVRCF